MTLRYHWITRELADLDRKYQETLIKNNNEIFSVTGVDISNRGV